LNLQLPIQTDYLGVLILRFERNMGLLDKLQSSAPTCATFLGLLRESPVFLHH